MTLLHRFPRLRRGLCMALTGALLLPNAPALAATTPLANQPIFSTSEVPGNLALALSVEFPTVTRVAHVANYTSTRSFLGYFDPNKCYAYVKNTTAVTSPGGGTLATKWGDSSYFQPVGLATNRTCSGRWSGNFLNWATLTAIDPFRWAMTGGRRVVDEVGNTIIEKGWHSGQGSYFPTRNQTDRTEGKIPLSEVAGATPFGNAVTSLSVAVNGLGYMMQVDLQGGRSRTFDVRYFHFSGTPGDSIFAGTPVATGTGHNAYSDWGEDRPVSGVNKDNFAVEYLGSFTAPETGNYIFQTNSDDGVRVWVNTSGTNTFDNSNRVIDNWTDHAPTLNQSGSVYLTAGQNFNIRIRYYEKGGGAVMQFSWRTPSASSFSAFSESVSGAQNYTVRVKVCDPSPGSGGVETNCVQYGEGNWKPEGLIQEYSQKMRFSAFGYLNETGNQRDGGVLRARQKFVAPTQPVPGQAAANNSLREWDPTTGIMVRNPDSADATATNTSAGLTGDNRVIDSGVMNYLNKFGQILLPTGTSMPSEYYKGNDPVGELYYATLRYFANLGNVPEWSNLNTTDNATKRKRLDGFPVLTSWDDPIQHSCQRNFVLGIGDIYTHDDANVAGVTGSSVPQKVKDDKHFNGPTVTEQAGRLYDEGPPRTQIWGSGLGTYSSGRSNRYTMIGLAFDANTRDIRPDNAQSPQTIGKQTVQTYWVDVLEAPFEKNNQFYLAAKFGGLDQSKLPANFDPYTFAGDIPLDWWSTTADTVGTGSNTQRRPDNYFTAGSPDAMVEGLSNAFRRIANSIQAYTTSFSLSSAQVSSLGAASYAAQYDSKDWTGRISANRITFDSDGNPTSTQVWSTGTTLQTQLAGSGWNTGRIVATFSGSAGIPFRYDSLSSDQQGWLDTSYGAGNDGANYLNWLRGDRTNERSTTSPTAPYRTRSLLLGDIVNAKVTPVGPPSMSFSDAVNPGYAAFKTAHADRPVVVYAGANDGMLHAFDGALEGTNAGKERFAYVPSFLFGRPAGQDTGDGLLARLGDPNYEHRFYVDGTPLAFDIDFNHAGGTFTTTNAANADWRTVLIGGLGKGGKGFYAIDVTDPAAMNSETNVAGKVLWEFTDADMGFSYGAPVVVKTRKYGWVVLFTGGYNSAGTKGYLYVVNPRDGSLIQKIETATAASGMAQASAYVQDFSDGTADAVYAGDLDGQIWRFDLTAAKGSTGGYPEGQRIALLADASGKAQPVTTQPLIEIQPNTKKRFVLVGTGRLLDASDIQSSDVQSYYAIIDGNAATFGVAGTTYPIRRADLDAVSDLTEGVALGNGDLGWYVDLGVDDNVAWRMTSAATSYSGVVAFTTLKTAGDACSPSGSSRIYALDFGAGKTVLADGSPFQSVNAAITDLRFLSVDGKVRLVSGDNQGTMRNTPINLPGIMGLRLLNWREVPTVD